MVLKTENRAWWLNPYSLSTWGNGAGGFLSLRLVQGGARDYVMVQVSVTVVKYHDQKPLEEKGFISVSSLQSIIRGIQGRNLEPGTEAEATQEYGLLACSLWPAKPASLYDPGTACPGVASPQ